MTESPLYLDNTRPIQARVQDLVGRMTLAEKAAQLSYKAPAIDRLAVPAYNYWNEALHGVARNGRATVFPQAIGMAATWDAALIQKIAAAISDEARAKYNAALQSKGYTVQYEGLNFWTPNINIFRDPRWGRGQETWGEDPFLTGELASAFVRGLQGDDATYLKTAACAKHFAVHSGPEKERHTFDAQVSDRDLYSTYLPAFKKLVTEAHVEAVMGAYNRVNGEPCCASQRLLVDILREEWQFEGHVVSDCGAISDIYLNHKVVPDAAHAVALAIRRGCDLGCDWVTKHVVPAVESNLVSEAEIDVALARIFTTRFKLGMFDPPSAVPWSGLGMEIVGSQAHRELAYEAAVKSVVLLKNSDNLLPLNLEQPRNIYVVGPTAADENILLGNYHGISPDLSSLLAGITGRIGDKAHLEYRPGCPLVPLAAASTYNVGGLTPDDVVIACLGITPQIEGEEGDAIFSEADGDRDHIGLPSVQVELVKNMAAQGAKIVLVLSGGSPLAFGEILELVQAVVFIWYPGQEGGRAVASVLFGDEAPSGKLPLTFPASLADLPPFEDYSMAGRTYRFSEREPLYPFGFGLSYSRFEYGNFKLAKTELARGEALPVEVTLTNTGAVAAEEVAQLYLSDLEASVTVPRCSLVGFSRVRLEPGESRLLSFVIEPEMMKLVNDQGQAVLEAGQFEVWVGGCSPSNKGVELGAPRPVRAIFTVK